MRLLVADNHLPSRKSISSGLRRAGYAVDIAADGESALAYAMNSEYDVVVMDVLLPALDGLSVLKELQSGLTASPKLRVWSSACSTGEEPYSIAAMVRDGLTSPSSYDVKILATDVDTQVLATAQRGLYSDKSIRDLDPSDCSRWFLRGTGKNAGRIRVRKELQELVSFNQLNLLEPFPMEGPFDVIFCRNVLIYFGTETQRGIVSRFARVQKPGQLLFMGHAENISRITTDYELIGQTIYRRV